MNQPIPPQPFESSSYGPGPSPDGGTSRDDRFLSAAAHAATFFEGGIVVPFIIYFMKKDDNKFVAFHALQSGAFGLAFLALSILTCGFGALVLVIPYFIFEVIATLKAYDGQWYELPWAGAWAKKQLGLNTPPSAQTF